MRLKLLSISCLALFFMTAMVAAAAEETFHQTYPVQSGTAVEIDNVNGDISVETWDNDYVDVVAVKRTSGDREDLQRVTIDVVNNGTLTIKTLIGKPEPESEFFITRMIQKFTAGFSSSPSVSVGYKVTVPANALLAVARTKNGNIDVDGTRGDSQFRTTNGNVKVDRAGGIITSETTNGNVTVLESPGLEKAKTVNGSIEVTFPKVIEIDEDISVVNGSITLNASSDMDAKIDFRAVNGRISAEGFSITVDTVSQRQFKGTLGNGGRTITAHTVNGSIRLNKR